RRMNTFDDNRRTHAERLEEYTSGPARLLFGVETADGDATAGEGDAAHRADAAKPAPEGAGAAKPASDGAGAAKPASDGAGAAKPASDGAGAAVPAPDAPREDG